MNQVSSGLEILGRRPNGFYDILAKLPPGLMLDVGAGAGAITKRMLRDSPQSRVIAFEPFPGNYPHFERSIGGDPRVTLVKAAVAAEASGGKLFVAGTVSGSEKGWEKLVGYSSAGFLIAAGDAREGNSIAVNTVRIDDMIGTQHVRLMKVDVQGGELGVLRSAERAIASGRVDVMFVEYTGGSALLDYLLQLQLRLFDSEYVLVPRKPRARRSWWKAIILGKRHADLSNWDIVGGATLSSGASAYRAWPRVAAYDDFSRFLAEERRKVGSVWTDLVVVAPHFLDEFMAAAAKAAAQSPDRGLSS